MNLVSVVTARPLSPTDRRSGRHIAAVCCMMHRGLLCGQTDFEPLANSKIDARPINLDHNSNVATVALIDLRSTVDI
jgi:hypothetical protein